MAPVNLDGWLESWVIPWGNWLWHWWDASLSWLHEIQEARERAERLLRLCLTDGEYASYLSLGYIELPSLCRVNRRYRIPGNGGRVRVYEQGRFCGELCVGPLDPLPTADVVLLHKLMIEGNEEDYLRAARWIQPVIPALIFVDSDIPDSLRGCDRGIGQTAD